MSLKGLSTLLCSWTAPPPPHPRFVGVFFQIECQLPISSHSSSFPQWQSTAWLSQVSRRYPEAFKFAWHASRSHSVLHMFKMVQFVLLISPKSITSRLQMMFSIIPLTFLANLSLNTIALLKNGLSAVLRHEVLLY